MSTSQSAEGILALFQDSDRERSFANIVAALHRLARVYGTARQLDKNSPQLSALLAAASHHASATCGGSIDGLAVN